MSDSETSDSSEELCDGADALFCIKIDVPTMKDDIKVTDESFDFSAALESVYPLTDIICTYLSFSELHTVSTLSEMWLSSAKSELAKRKAPSYLIGCMPTKAGPFQCFQTDKLFFHQRSSAIFFYNHEQIEMHDYICTHADDKIVRKTFFEYICDVVHDKIEFCCISLQNCHHFTTKTKEMVPYYGGIFLPEIPNLRIKQFYFRTGTTNNVFEKMLYDNETVECLLVLANCQPIRPLSQLMRCVERKQTEPYSLGGGTVWGIKSALHDKISCSKLIKRTDLYCISFLKNNANVNNDFFTASAVTIEGQFAEGMLKFKDKCERREHSILFRFCCTRKDFASIEEPLLRKHFPETHLVQFDVNGEIGCNRVPNVDQTESSAKKKRMTFHYYHEYTTILVFISWGRIKN